MENNGVHTTQSATAVLTPEVLQEQWQGHRRLTRKVIEAFPEDRLFTYTIGGMRPFAELAMEMIDMTIPGIHGVATGQWLTITDFKKDYKTPTTRQELLQLWDYTTQQINDVWPQIPDHRFQEVDVAFGKYEGPGHETLFYFIDNEIHHRGQGYVYLRSLGIEPPPFWDRS